MNLNTIYAFFMNDLPEKDVSFDDIFLLCEKAKVNFLTSFLGYTEAATFMIEKAREHGYTERMWRLLFVKAKRLPEDRLVPLTLAALKDCSHMPFTTLKDGVTMRETIVKAFVADLRFSDRLFHDEWDKITMLPENVQVAIAINVMEQEMPFHKKNIPTTLTEKARWILGIDYPETTEGKEWLNYFHVTGQNRDDLNDNIVYHEQTTLHW